MVTPTVVCVFAKPPRPGAAKTRLAPAAGDTAAASLARAFLHDTWAALSTLPWVRPVLATTEMCNEGFALPGGTDAWLQGDGDLGHRLERVLRRALSTSRLAIAVGADTPGLPARLLEEARDALDHADAVLGPSEDGGFYLVGLRRCVDGLFADLPWSTERTFASTLDRLRQRGMTVARLAPWFDVDRPEDLWRLHTLIQRGDLNAPETARVLAGLKLGQAVWEASECPST